MVKLEETLIRDLKENKENILSSLEKNGSVYYTIEFPEEQGEVAIIFVMDKKEIEIAAIRAVCKVFAKKVSNLSIQGNCLGFTII